MGASLRGVSYAYRTAPCNVTTFIVAITTMRQVSEIIVTLGGSAKVADALKLPLTTVDAWRRNESVPSWRRGALVALARRWSAASRG